VDQGCREQILSEDYFDFIIEYARDIPILPTTGEICYNIINQTHAVTYLPVDMIPPNFFHIIGYGAYPNIYTIMDLESQEASGITRLRQIPNLVLRGSGVIIGIIDTGIDYTHEAFRNTDGTTRIISIWDQTIQGENTAPEGFAYGTEYTREQINAALLSDDPLSIVPSMDENGHGTSVAGIAAGSLSSENNFSGVVPDAELIVVKLKQAKQNLQDFFRIPAGSICFQENDIMQAVKYIDSTANRLLLPLSLCISIGTSQGSHDGREALSTYLADVGDRRGHSIAIAAGNEGNRGHHFFGVIDINRNVQYRDVELRVGPNETGFSMELWGAAPGTFSIDILSPGGEYIPRIPPRLAESREIRFIFENTIINIDYQIVETQSGDFLILIRFTNPSEGIWKFRVYASGDLLSSFHIWLPMYGLISDATYFTEPDPEYTVTSPGNVHLPIVVTAYEYPENSLYINASRGYSREEDITPDLAAPGVNLIAPVPNNSAYTTVSGTSVSSAHTAGVAAMLLEWGISRGNYPQLDTVEIRNILIRGAKRDPNLTYPNKEWGFGILDLYNSFLSFRG
jgi:subtilisin family serine protease